MTERTKFLSSSATTKEENLIIELIRDLNEVTSVFIKLNHRDKLNHLDKLNQEFLYILQDASIGYAGGIVRDLIKMLSEKDQQIHFIEESKRIYLYYIEDIKKDLDLY